ncbi:hypothetical protein [Dactylosporangium sp. CA-233914]|uniref:hypothetical protein n=1 Tax=Dactylosporangium sp. CA-233914 TaxID=3239934 RepID=UPI003D90DF68
MRRKLRRTAVTTSAAGPDGRAAAKSAPGTARKRSVIRAAVAATALTGALLAVTATPAAAATIKGGVYGGILTCQIEGIKNVNSGWWRSYYCEPVTINGPFGSHLYAYQLWGYTN